MNHQLSTKNKISYILLILTLPFSYTFLSYIFTIALYIIFDTNPILDDIFFIDTICCFCILFIYLPWFMKLKKPTSLTKIKIKDFLYCIIATLGVGGISSIWLSFAYKFLTNTPVCSESLTSFEETWQRSENEAYLWLFLSVSILGPIVEEVLFRGLIYTYAERLLGSVPAIFLSSLLFGLWHQEPVQCVYTTLLGIALAIIYRHYRSLKFPILIHILNNFLSSLPQKFDTEDVNFIIDKLSMIFMIPTIISICLLFLKIKSENNKTKSIEKNIQNKAEI